MKYSTRKFITHTKNRDDVDVFTNNDQIMNLINEYEKYPVLWDPNNKFYKLNNKKKDAWDEMASFFNINGEVLKKKMNSILNSYRRGAKK
ncbi:hypothetical protein QTP88_015077 [Uroleucon formosanum]